MQHRRAAVLLLSLSAVTAPRAQDGPAVPPALLEQLAWREVGPYRGGRCAAVTGIPGVANVYYFGATGGGVWKTEDAGRSWENVSDEFFGGSIGAVAVAPSDHNVVWVGGGECTVRGNVSHGDGVWRSTDAGRTWKHVGLPDSRHVCRIRVHPGDPDLAYAAVLGHLYGPHAERGVYRTKDGGASWERVLHVDDDAGAVDLVMDPTNPRILYASLWRVRRTPYSLESGGEGSGLWKSTDGGDSWEEITRHPGLPRGPIGISGIAVSQSDPDNVYAIIEAEDGGVFRSRDAGATWTRTNSDRALRQRAWYYTRIYADPADAETVYVPNVAFHRSVDGGVTFKAIATPHGDNHDLWIAPEDPKRMIEGNDGGANVSHDGGATWSTQDNQPTAQIYRVSTDNAVPYRILGAQQDNSALRIRSRSLFGGAIGTRDWEPTAGGESGHIVAKPDVPDVVYGGSYGGYLTRVDHRTGEIRAVNPWPDNPMGQGAGELRYRFQWNFPLFFSPHDPDVLYAAAQVLFRSRDGGNSWDVISPDLTRNEKGRQGPSGGPITKDNTGVEYYCTIFAALESPHEPGVLWAGSDDGLLHLSRDGGASWNDVTPDWPEWTRVNSLEPHPGNPAGLYVAGTRYESDDFRPYLYRTTDYGQTWQQITDGIDPQHFTRVLRADPERAGLLYAGTERGVYVSFDDGARWQPMQGKLPIVPVTDLALKEGDLIAATQGRGFWVLDDLALVRQLGPRVAEGTAWLFEPEPALRRGGGAARDPGDAGTNPHAGAVLHFFLGEEPAAATDVRLELLEEDGAVIRTFTRKPAPAPKREEDAEEEGEDGGGDGGDAGQLELAQGLNTFVWDLRYPDAERFPGMVLWNRRLRGPRAVPGSYRARLTVGDWSATVPLEVRPDPLSSASPEDMVEQFAFLTGVRDKLTETHRAVRQIRDARGQLDELLARLEKRQDAAPLAAAAKELRAELTGIEETLYQTRSRSPQDPLNFPIRLDDKLAGLMGLVGLGDHAPTAQAEEVRRELVGAIDAQLSQLRALLAEEVPALNARLREAGVPWIELSPPDAGSAPREGTK